DKAVAWAVEKGITAGTSENEFSPEMTVTRAQFVTMLWAANGMPEVDGEMPFKDVPEDSYYAKAVAWAYANDITAGKSADSFAPDDPCTRGQIMTFLYNAYGE
ncbi:MAG: S-layer homology domain-containing protein, partial [Firmicutes bacterium]|nr:S-layer homology domain-containing protein [Bacillota bacterium]